MQFNTLKLTLLSFITATSFLGCGEGAGSSTQATPSSANAVPDTNNTSKIINKIQDPLTTAVSYADLFSLLNKQTDKTGLIIDAHGVEGLTIQCGTNQIPTNQYGLFTCDTFPLSIYLGNFKIGTLTALPKDKIIYTQDILHLPRAATMHPDVTKLSMILQSLDEDADITNGIKLTQESIDLLDNELANFTSIEDLTVENVDNILDSVIASRKADNPEVKLTKVVDKKAQINLTEALANTPAKNLNITSFHSITL